MKAKKLRKQLRDGLIPSGIKQSDVKRAFKVEFRKEIDDEVEERRNEELKERSRKQGKGGLTIEKPHRKDYIREKALGGSNTPFVAGERLKTIKESGILSNIIFQGDQNSCVSCSFTWANLYNSWFRSNNKVNLDWKYLWEGVPKEDGGSKPKNNGQFLRHTGQPEVGANEPEKYKIKNYLYLENRNYEGVKEALRDTPVIIGVYADEAGISDNHFGHAVVCIDLDENGNYVCINWWRLDCQDIVTVSKEAKLLTAVTLEDLDDNIDLSQVRRGWRGVLSHWL